MEYTQYQKQILLGLNGTRWVKVAALADNLKLRYNVVGSVLKIFSNKGLTEYQWRKETSTKQITPTQRGKTVRLRYYRATDKGKRMISTLRKQEEGRDFSLCQAA